MKKRFAKDNKGYSLVELIIVVAIIIVLATMSLVSLTLINSARAKDASVTFGSEVNALKTKCMNMKPNGSDYDYYALSLYLDSNDAYNICLVKHKVAGGFEYITDENVTLSSRVDITYHTGNDLTKVKYRLEDDSDYKEVESSDSPVHPGLKGSSTNGPIILTFDKRGNCYSGYGEYKFLKKNGTYMARINIKQNGSIDIR